MTLNFLIFLGTLKSCHVLTLFYYYFFSTDGMEYVLHSLAVSHLKTPPVNDIHTYTETDIEKEGENYIYAGRTTIRNERQRKRQERLPPSYEKYGYGKHKILLPRRKKTY